jgi:hypothetical protein
MGVTFIAQKKSEGGHIRYYCSGFRIDKRRGGRDGRERRAMNEETMNLEIRKFLKRVGVTSQREIEQAVRGAIAAGRIKGDQAISVRVTLEVAELGVRHVMDDTVVLE